MSALSYTVLAVLGVALTVVLDLVVLRSRVLTRRTFWVAYVDRARVPAAHRTAC